MLKFCIHLGINEGGTRLSVYYFASVSKNMFSRSHFKPLYKSYTEAQELIDSTLNTEEIRNTTGSGKALAMALDNIRIDLETKNIIVESGNYRQAQQVIILLSNGLFSPNDKSPIQTANTLKRDFDVEMYSIFVGDPNKDAIGYITMKEIASQSENATFCFAIKDTDESVDDVLDQIIGDSPQPQNVTVRLSDGSSSSEGRFEVFHNNAWGTVCSDYFDTNAAAVVCRMLGLPSSDAWPRPNAYYGTGKGTIWLDNVRCTGHETNIGDCNANPWGNSDCNHNEDVGVVCGPPNVTVQLTGGVLTFHGRVEIRVYDMWGTICDRGFGDNEATVICRMLGHHRGGTLLKRGSVGIVGAGRGPIWLNGVKCSGNETRIQDCVHKPWGSAKYCLHSDDVSVMCHSSQADPCMDGWWKHGSSCYFFSDITGNITYAQTQCNSSGGYLAEIEDGAENTFLKIIPSIYEQMITGSEYYIGLNHIKQELNYFWFGTNRPLNQTGYSNWMTGEPNNRWDKEDCVVLRRDGY